MLAKAVAVFVAFMFIVYVIGLWINIGTQNLVRRQIIENTHLQLTYFSESLDREIENVFRQQVALRNDFGLRRLLLYQDLSDMSSIFLQLRRISGSFTTIYNSSPHVSDVGIYMPNFNRISKWGLLFALPNEEDRALITSVQQSGQSLFHYGQDLVIGMPVHEGLMPRGHNDAVIYAIFSGEAIVRTLNQMAHAYGLNVALFSSGRQILVAGQSLSGNHIFDYARAVNSDEPHLININGTSMWALRTPSDRFGLELVALLPTTQVDAVIIPTLIATVILFTVSMITGVVIFTIYISRLIRQIYLQKQASEKARFDQLHLQITPHFLYNCFYQIYRLGKLMDTDAVSEMSLRLSQYYQYITRSTDDTATLQLEAKHAEDFAAIQNIRYGGRIECRFGPIPEPCRDMKMPKLFLQPLVENAYIHGMDSPKSASLVEVNFVYENGKLLISVEDDGSSLDDIALSRLEKRLTSTKTEEETSSMFNIRKRLEFMYGNNILMRVKRGAMNGLRIEIEICKQSSG